MMKKRKRMPLKNFIKRNGRMLVGGTIIAVLIIMALFAPMIATHDPDAYDYTNRFALPSGEHFLGTDTHGRDIFSRMVYGTRISLLLGFGVNFLAVFAGAICGILCGYFKKVDAILMRVMEGLHSLPTTLLAMVVASVLGPGIEKLMIALVVTALPGVCRMTRSQVLSLRQKEFVEVEKAMGASHLRIMLLHIMPSCSHYLIIRFCTGISGTILSAATLAYLSVGLDPTIPNWGAIIADGQGMFLIYPHMILWPGVWMIIAVFGFIFFGEGLRERLDPRLK